MLECAVNIKRKFLLISSRKWNLNSFNSAEVRKLFFNVFEVKERECENISDQRLHVHAS